MNVTDPEKVRQDLKKVSLIRLKERGSEKLLRCSQMSYRLLKRCCLSCNPDTSSDAIIVTFFVTIT